MKKIISLLIASIFLMTALSVGAVSTKQKNNVEHVTDITDNGGLPPTWTTLISTQSYRESDNPNIAVDKFGTAHAVWFDSTPNFDTDGNAEFDTFCGTDWDVLYRNKPVDEDWGPIEVVSTESDKDGVYFSPLAIDVDDEGRVHVAWTDRTTYQDECEGTHIFYKTRNPNGLWTSTEIVSSSYYNGDHDVDMIVDQQGNVHFVWWGICDHVFGLVYKKKTGGTWGNLELAVKSTGSSQANPKISCDSDCNPHITWMVYVKRNKEDKSGNEIFYTYKHPNAGWMEKEHVSTFDYGTWAWSNNFPEIAVDKFGKVHISWSEAYDGTSGKIYYRMKASNHDWNHIEIISDENNGNRDQSIDVDSYGNVHFIWDYHHFAKYRFKSVDGQLSDIEDVSTDQEGNHCGYINCQLDVASDDTIHVVWKDYSITSMQTEIGPDIYYRQKIFGNQHPEKPTIEGDLEGNYDTEYTYTAVSIDPDEDQLYYRFTWDDGVTSSWLGPFDSGEPVSASHIWGEGGEYSVKVTVKDVNGDGKNSEISVTMPKSKPSIQNLFTKFFDQFLLLKQLLQRLPAFQ